MSFIYWGDGEPLFFSPILPTTGMIYWGDGEPVLELSGGLLSLEVTLDTPPELYINMETMDRIELGIVLGTPPEISIVTLTIAGMEFGFPMPEQPNMAMDAATVASTEISLAVYTENLQIIPLDAIAAYVIPVALGDITIIGYGASIIEGVQLDTLSEMIIEALDISGFEYSAIISEVVDLVIELFDVSVIMGGRRLFPIPLGARRKNELNAGRRLFPVRK